MFRVLFAIGWILFFSGCVVWLNAAVSGDEPNRTAKLEMDVGDLLGTFHSIHQNDQEHLRVFVFLSTSCPISNSYLPELNRIYEQKINTVDFFGVISDPSVNRSEAIKHSAEFQIRFPILFDSSGYLVQQLSPTHVPEVFVIDGKGRIRYRGAIDNAYESLGRRRANVEKHFLRDAIASVLNGTVANPEKTSPVGCRISTLKEWNHSTEVTFCRDVAPVLFARCLNCHRDGEVAPFQLSNYEEAKKHSEMIVEVTQQKLMPPWMPANHLQVSPSMVSPRFVGDRKLTDHEIEILRTWLITVVQKEILQIFLPCRHMLRDGN